MKEIKIQKKSIGILLGVVLISSILVFKNFLFGGQYLAYTDIGSDTAGQYLMHYQTIINHLREGSFSLWDFNNGVGINMYSLNLFDPFLMVIYGLGTVLGNKVIYEMLVYMHMLRMLLAAVVVYCYLSSFRLSEYSKVTASYIYAFSGFMVVWGQHYQFGTIAIIFPLLLYMVEKALRKAHWNLGVTFSCAIACFCSMYFGYMQLVGLGFYVLFRAAWNEKLFSKNGIKKVFAIYGSMILGIGMGMFQLLPSAAMIFGVSGRMDGEPMLHRIMEALMPYKSPYYKTLFSRFFSSNLLGTNEFSGYQNYYEAPNVFLSAFFLLAAVQFVYLIMKKRSDADSCLPVAFTRRQRDILFVSMLTCLFLLAVPLGSLVFNGFAYPFSRHTFICMPFFVWMAAWVLDRMVLEQEGSRHLFLISGLACVSVYGVHLLGARRKLAVLLLLLTIAMLFALWQILKRNCRFKKWMQALLILSVIGTMVLDSYFSFSYERGVLDKNTTSYIHEMYDPAVEAALSYLKEYDASFYRVEKDYTVGDAADCLNALAQNYSGVSTYNSTLNSDTAKFFKEIWPNIYYINDDHVNYADGSMDIVPSTLLHVKYVISKQSDLGIWGFVLHKQLDDIYIHENTLTSQIGKFYTKVLTEEDFERTKAQKDLGEVLVSSLICDTLPHFTVSSQKDFAGEREEVTQIYNPIVEKEQGIVTISFASDVKTDKMLYLEFDVKEHLGGSLWANLGNHRTNLFSEDEIQHAVLPLPYGVREITLADSVRKEAAPFVVENIRLYEQDAVDMTALSENIFIEQPKKDSVVEGRADVKEDGVLMLAIPYETGWHAYVDGEEVTIHKVNYGFSGIELEKGEHEIRFVFECPGFMPGVAISILFLLLTVVIWCCIVKKKKHF